MGNSLVVLGNSDYEQPVSSITSLHFQGFKSIEDVRLPLGQLNVLIGANGTGKSNFLGAFRFLNRIVSKQLQSTVFSAGGPDRFLFHGSKRTPVMELAFRFGENSYRVKLGATPESLFISQELAGYHSFSGDYPKQLGKNEKESKLDEAAVNSPVAQYVKTALNDWATFHFHDTSNTGPSKQVGELDDNRHLKPDAGNLAAFLYFLKQKHVASYTQIVSQIRLVAPFFDDFILEPSRLNETKIKLEWTQKGSEAYFDGHSLSDGTLRFMCLATLLLQPTLPTLILIDEPELGLHPFAITLLADLLRVASERTQLLVATQSVTLLNQLKPEDIYITEHDGVRTTAQRLPDRISDQKLAEWTSEYPLGELWEKNVFGGRPK